MRVKRTPDADLYEVKFGNQDIRPVTLYMTKSIGLPHGERLLFDGFITNLNGKEAGFFRKFFAENGIQDLMAEAADWDGSWAIIYINQNGTIYCFTDPLGKKQLYYDQKGNIASNIRELRGDAELNDLYLGEIHKWGYNVDDLTPFKGVRRIMPNMLYMFMGGKVQNIQGPYFDWRWTTRLQPENFRMLIHNSVVEYTKTIPESEKNIAVLLSGGIDSSIISYELLQIQKSGTALKGKTLRFYTINNQEDAPFVGLFTKTFGIKVKILSYDMKDVNLGQAVIINETPVDLGSMVPNQLMFQSIPEKFIFTGDGPDEMFGGYRRIDEYDSQKSDIFHELSFYHLPRLEKAATHFKKELRCPWLSYDIVRYALSLPFEERKHKAPMKAAYAGIIPDEIINRPKLPLKNDEFRAGPMVYRRKIIELFSRAMKTEQPKV